MDIKAPEEVLKAIDVLNVQGKSGAFTLQNLAALGPRVITPTPPPGAAAWRPCGRWARRADDPPGYR